MTDNIETIAGYLLYLSHEEIIVPVILLGLASKHRNYYAHALILLMLTLLINPVMKNIFKVPLMPHLGDHTYAIPSGHTHVSAAFYGYLAMAYIALPVRIGLMTLIGVIGSCLVICKYHQVPDVIAGAASAFATIYAYVRLRDYFIKRGRSTSFVAGMITLAFMLTVTAQYWQMKGSGTHMWMAFYVLFGFTLVYNRHSDGFSKMMPATFSVINYTLYVTTGAAAVWIMLRYANFMPPWLAQLPWLAFSAGLAVFVRPLNTKNQPNLGT